MAAGSVVRAGACGDGDLDRGDHHRGDHVARGGAAAAGRVAIAAAAVRGPLSMGLAHTVTINPAAPAVIGSAAHLWLLPWE